MDTRLVSSSSIQIAGLILKHEDWSASGSKLEVMQELDYN